MFLCIFIYIYIYLRIFLYISVYLYIFIPSSTAALFPHWNSIVFRRSSPPAQRCISPPNHCFIGSQINAAPTPLSAPFPAQIPRFADAQAPISRAETAISRRSSAYIPRRNSAFPALKRKLFRA